MAPRVGSLLARSLTLRAWLRSSRARNGACAERGWGDGEWCGCQSCLRSGAVTVGICCGQLQPRTTRHPATLMRKYSKQPWFVHVCAHRDVPDGGRVVPAGAVVEGKAKRYKEEGPEATQQYSAVQVGAHAR